LPKKKPQSAGSKWEPIDETKNKEMAEHGKMGQWGKYATYVGSQKGVGWKPLQGKTIRSQGKKSKLCGRNMTEKKAIKVTSQKRGESKGGRFGGREKKRLANKKGGVGGNRSTMREQMKFKDGKGEGE